MTGGVKAVLAKLRTCRSLEVGGGGVNPRTVRALIKHGYVYTWSSGEFDLWGPYVNVTAKRNDTGRGSSDGFVRTLCSCDAGVLNMRCETCGGEAVKI